MSYTVFIVKDKKGMLPGGWITAVYPPGIDPSEYERSENSPWLIKTFKENPVPKRSKVKSHFGRDVVDYSKVHVFEDNKVICKSHNEVWNKYAINPPHNPPSFLKKASLIWDYGPGRTYSSPQTAFDALLAYQGSAVFTETHYVRGWSGEYAGDVVLHVHSLNPSPSDGYFLIFDAELGEVPIFQANETGISGPISDEYAGVNWFYAKGITIRVTGSPGYGIATTQVNPSGQTFFDMDRPVVQDCRILHLGVTKTDTVALFMPKCTRPLIERTLTLDFNHVAPTHVGVRRDWLQALVMKSCIGRSVADNFYFDPQSGYMRGVFIVNSLFKAGSNYSNFYQFEDQWLLINRINSIFEGGKYIFETPGKSAIATIDLESDGNVYNYSTSFGVDKSGEYTFNEHKNFFFVDYNSFDQTDALVDWDAIDDGIDPEEIPIGIDSVVWTNGRAIGGEDFHLRDISRDVIDIGPFQSTGYETTLLCGYCTQQDVKDEVGVKPEDLDRTSDRTLDILLCEWIKQCTEIIDRYCETTFATPVEYGIRRACTMMVGHVVNIARQKRKMDAISPGDFDVKEVEAEILTDEIKEILNLYKAPEATIGDGSEEHGSLGLATLTRDDYYDESSDC